MKTLEEIKQFYDSELAGDLEILEKRRKGVLRKLAYVAIALACITAGVIAVLTINIAAATPPFFFIPIILSVMIGAGLCVFISRDYRMEFKILIIDKIVHFVDENLKYNRTGFIHKSVFMASEIFKTKPNRYKGDDLVQGRIGATEIEFSEVEAKHKSGSGKNRSEHVVFKGLFFIGDFHKHFTCRAVVLPDTAQKLFGRLGRKLQSMNFTRDDLIKLEDPEFEKHFVVYSNDQVEARYILSTSLMRRIVEFKEKSDRKIHLSFIGSKMFVAISYNKDLFEPRLFRTVLDFEPIREYFEDLQLAIGIVDDLNLNTRIWSKR